MTGTGRPLFPWPAQLLNSANGPDCSISNDALRHTFPPTLIQSKWDSLEGGVSEVSVCCVFWPLEDSSQISYSLVLSCKLTGLQLRLYFHYIQESPSSCLLLQPPLFLRNTLRCKLVHILGNEVRALGRDLALPVSAFTPWGKISEPGFWSWGWGQWWAFLWVIFSLYALRMSPGPGIGVGVLPTQQLSFLVWNHPLMSWVKGLLGPQYSQWTIPEIGPLFHKRGSGSREHRLHLSDWIFVDIIE